MKDSIRVALIQPKPYPAAADPMNLGHALQLMEKCRGENLDVICFPEYFPYVGDEELAAVARRQRVYIVAGLAETDGDKVYSTATLFDRNGRLVGRQRKYNLNPLEQERLGISRGDGLFRAFATDFGKIGLPLGIDFWGQPDAARQLVDQGAEVIFNIGTFPVLRGHWTRGATVRAFDHFLCVVGVNTADYNALIGERRVHQHGGESFVIQPPRMLDKEDFRRWISSLDNTDHWITTRLDALEQIHIAEVHPVVIRRFRDDFKKRLGFRSASS